MAEANNARQAAPRPAPPRRPTAPPPRGEQPMPFYEGIWRFIRPVLYWLAALLIVAGILAKVWNVGYSYVFSPVNEADTAPVTFVIARGSSVSSIGRQLTEANLIRNKGVFQYYAEFLGLGNKLKAGTYELSPGMSVREIITELSLGDGGQSTMRVRVIEGMTVEEMAQSLLDQGALKDTSRFLSLCKSGEAFAGEYDFVQKVIDLEQPERRYVLEGYLFPDTYEIFVGASEETIIKKMLSRTREVYNVGFLDDSDRQKMTMDEVLALASLIEREAKTPDFARVSAVFRNRIAGKQRLESCVTVQYALRMKRLALTAEDIAVNSPYNTYLVDGLPIGPVNNPGRNAIEAALNPDAEFVEQKYLFFCSKDPETGELQFSKTLKEHEAAAEEYRPLWKAFDAKNAAAGGNP